MKGILKFLLFFILIAVFYLTGVILLGQLTYYEPDEIENLSVGQEVAFPLQDSVFTAMIWNIGFAGMGAQSDFFYDGGKMVRSPKDLNKKYWKGIQDFIYKQNDVNFLLLQEVDVNSKRSRHINQADTLKKYLHEKRLGGGVAFAANYKVNFVPLKFFDPLGKVHSGLMTFSPQNAGSSFRYQYPGSYSWPNKLFFLRRCALVQKFRLEHSTDTLVIVNTHLSAYDDGSMKAQEMEKLKEIITEEYERGNFVIVGADWNQVPESKEIQQFLPDWTFVYDDATPTNRSLETPYNENSTTKVIDYFLVSPNVQIISVETIDLDFAYSDHQPVKLEFQLK